MDEAWLSTLYERNYALLFRVGRVFLGNDPSQHGVIEDQIQETFIQAWQKQHILEKHPNPDGWLVETFRYCLLNQCRKQVREWKRRSFSLDEETAQQIPDTSVPSAEEFVQTREQLAILQRLLGDRDADIFIRYCLYGVKARDVGAAYGMSEAAIRVCASRVKKKLLANQQLFLSVVLLIAMGMKGGGLP